VLFTHHRHAPVRELNNAAVWELNSRTVGSSERFMFASDWLAAYRCLEGILEGERIEMRPPWEQKWPERFAFGKAPKRVRDKS
jgi:hypothetical protein